MLLLLLCCLMCSSVVLAVPQRPTVRTVIIPLPKDASGQDVYPDCSRGKVCLPEAAECAKRRDKAGSLTINGNKTYWFSWQSDEEVLRKARWNWFTGRNYCRKRCMDLVSFESASEWNLVSDFMEGAGVEEIWTSGRLCDAEVTGCDAPHYQPLNINGWFWASTLIKMLPTNATIDGGRFRGVNEWSRNPVQPDGFTPQGGLGTEPCMGVKDTGDGLKWHDTSCHDRRAIVCEDLPQQNIQFVRNSNPNVQIP